MPNADAARCPRCEHPKHVGKVCSKAAPPAYPRFHSADCGCDDSPGSPAPTCAIQGCTDKHMPGDIHLRPSAPPAESPAAGEGLPEKIERELAEAEKLIDLYIDPRQTGGKPPLMLISLRAAIRAELDTEYKRGWVAAKNESNVPEARHD